MPLKILVSSLACSSGAGSEALVGFRMAQALAERFKTEVVTSAGMEAAPGLTTHRIGVRFDDPNDVAPGQLLRFELAERLLFRRLLRRGRFDLLHRVTPSGHKASLLARCRIPLILGPVLGADPPPQSFQAVFQPAMPRSYSPR